MKKSIRLLTLATVVFPTLACTLFNPAARSQESVLEVALDESPVPDSFTLVVEHPSHGDLAALLAVHALRAAELERRPFVEFSADWCPPCIALANSLTDHRMVEAFRGTYVIRLDIDEWKGRSASTGFVVIGVPTFFELAGDGLPTGRMLTGAAWGRDLPENMARPLKEFFEGPSEP